MSAQRLSFAQLCFIGAAVAEDADCSRDLNKKSDIDLKSSSGFFSETDCDISLQISETLSAPWPRYLSVDRANHLLSERGTVVYGSPAICNAFTDFKYPNDTHTALLINVLPIEQEDTAEGLLREFVKKGVCDDRSFYDLFSRAKKLLLRGEE